MTANPTRAALASRAFVLHQAKFGEDEATFSILAHDVFHQNGQSQLGPGRPFGHDQKSSLMSILSTYMQRDLEFLDAVCLAASHQTLIWYRPRQKTTINLRGTEIDVPMPSLVFLAHKGQLSIAAYRGERRPERDTKLLHCCLPNIQTNVGGWCSGGNQLPDMPSQHHIERMEKMFFQSPFTHWGHSRPSEAGDSMEDYFNALKGKPRFPTSQLGEMGATLTEWMDFITGKRSRF